MAELHCKLQEIEEVRDHQQKELMEIQRALADESREKEALQKSNSELRAAIKKAENERLR